MLTRQVYTLSSADDLDSDFTVIATSVSQELLECHVREQYPQYRPRSPARIDRGHYVYTEESGLTHRLVISDRTIPMLYLLPPQPPTTTWKSRLAMWWRRVVIGQQWTCFHSVQPTFTSRWKCHMDNGALFWGDTDHNLYAPWMRSLMDRLTDKDGIVLVLFRRDVTKLYILIRGGMWVRELNYTSKALSDDIIHKTIPAISEEDAIAVRMNNIQTLQAIADTQDMPVPIELLRDMYYLKLRNTIEDALKEYTREFSYRQFRGPYTDNQGFAMPSRYFISDVPDAALIVNTLSEDESREYHLIPFHTGGPRADLKQ